MCFRFATWSALLLCIKCSHEKLTGTLQSSLVEGVLSVLSEADSPDPHDYLHVNQMLGEEAKLR